MLHLLHIPSGHIIRFPCPTNNYSIQYNNTVINVEEYTKHRMRGRGKEYKINLEDVKYAVNCQINRLTGNISHTTFKNNKELIPFTPLCKQEFELIEVE